MCLNFYKCRKGCVKMKICILSMQRVENYGSLLQAYGLKKLLTEMGHYVDFLDIEPIKQDDILMPNERYVYINELDTYSTNFVMKKLKKLDRYILNRIHQKLIMHKQYAIFNDFRKNELEIRGTNGSNYYDFCIIGSDEVFNCASESPWGFTSQLFGNVKQADAVITYAASCGSTKLNFLSEAVQNVIKKNMQNIKAISVRDDNTMNFVKGLSEKDTPLYKHFDPVVISDFDKEIRRSILPDFFSQKYCILYSYRNRIKSNDEMQKIINFCKNHELELITLGNPQKWINKHYALDPFALLKAFSQAEFIITDTFHGAIFSAKYAKRFGIICRDSNANKLLDLIKELNIETHLTNGLVDIEEIYQINNDYNLSNNIELKEVKRTIEYFQEFLKCE